MVLSYGSTMPGEKTQTYCITYENAKSNKIIDVHQGTGMSGSARFRARPQTPDGSSDHARPGRPSGSDDEPAPEPENVRPPVGE